MYISSDLRMMTEIKTETIKEEPMDENEGKDRRADVIPTKIKEEPGLRELDDKPRVKEEPDVESGRSNASGSAAR